MHAELARLIQCQEGSCELCIVLSEGFNLHMDILLHLQAA